MAVVGASACLPELHDLTAVENPSDPTPRFEEPVVWIDSPRENGSVKRQELFTQGALVSFDGTFTPGDQLHVMAARVETPNLGFYILTLAVTDTVSPGPVRIRGTPDLVENSRRLRLKLRVRDYEKRLLSIDSVTVNLR